MVHVPPMPHALTNRDAAAVIDRLGLAPHPEGGWYKETWRPSAPDGSRRQATAIHFLLERGQRSHWHKVLDADEIWLWHAGMPLVLAMARDDAGPVSQTVLGPDIFAGQEPQVRIPAGWWQAAEPVHDDASCGWSLVSCVVAPGFEFSSFELAPPDWAPGC